MTKNVFLDTDRMLRAQAAEGSRRLARNGAKWTTDGCSAEVERMSVKERRALTRHSVGRSRYVCGKPSQISRSFYIRAWQLRR